MSPPEPVENHRLIRGINNPEDVLKENGHSFRFHGPFKALFYKLLNLIKPAPKEWLDDTYGNAAVLRDLYYEYLTHEGQKWRKDVLTRVIPFSICLASYDENYGEILDWFLMRITQEHEKGNLHFESFRVNPDYWFADGRGRIGFNENIRCKMIKDGWKL